MDNIGNNFFQKLTSPPLFLVIIFTLCFLTGFFYLINNFVIFGDDAGEYIHLSKTITSGYKLFGHFSAKRTPGYPAYLWICWQLFGEDNFLGVIFLNLILRSLGCIIIYVVVRKIFGLLASLVAVTLFIFNPLMNIYVGRISTEFMIGFLAVLFLYIYSFWVLRSGNNKILQIFIGCILGLSLLTRPDSIFAILFLMFFLLLKNKKPVYIILVIILLMLPWVIRNYVVFGKIIPFSTLGGLAFLSDQGASTSLADGQGTGFGWGVSSHFLKKFSANYPKSESYYDSLIYKEKLKYAIKHPKETVKIIAKNFLIFHYFCSWPMSNKYDPFYIFMLQTILVGLWLFFTRSTKTQTELLLVSSLLIIWAGFAFGYSLFTCVPRMRNSIEPMIIMLSSLGVREIISKYKNKGVLLISIFIIISMIAYLSPWVRYLLLNVVTRLF